MNLPTEPKTDFERAIIKSIEDAINTEADKIWGKKINELNDELKKSKATIISKAVLYIHNHVSYSTMGQELIIRVVQEDKP